jgi:hypothetical protein
MHLLAASTAPHGVQIRRKFCSLRLHEVREGISNGLFTSGVTCLPVQELRNITNVLKARSRKETKKIVSISSYQVTT